MKQYYVYTHTDRAGVVRYVGKGTGRRAERYAAVVASLIAGCSPRHRLVHRRMVAAVTGGDSFTVTIYPTGPDQADAYALECRLIAQHKREAEGGTLWNVLAGGEGFKGILHEDWCAVAAQAAATKRRTGNNGGAKAAATRRALRLAA
jgi:hypothetical protein